MFVPWALTIPNRFQIAFFILLVKNHHRVVFTTFYFGRGPSRAEEWNDQEQFIIFPSERKAAPPSVAVPPGAEEIWMLTVLAVPTMAHRRW